MKAKCHTGQYPMYGANPNDTAIRLAIRKLNQAKIFNDKHNDIAEYLPTKQIKSNLSVMLYTAQVL